jgi:hypothetical protein
MNKQLQKVMACLYLAAVLIPAVLSFSNVYEVSAQAETFNITLQQDPSVMMDTTSKTATPNNNYGTDTTVGVGESNSATDTHLGYLRFDVSVLPANITITSATLSLWVQTDKSDNARTMRAISIWKDPNNNSDWTELGVNKNQKKPGYGWSAGEYGPEIGNVALANNLAVNTKVDMTIDPAAVQEFINNNYYGFKLEMDTNTNDQYLFYSSDETTNPQYRPMLYVEYILGREDPVSLLNWKCRPGNYGTDGGFKCGSVTPNVSVPSPINVVDTQSYTNVPAFQAGSGKVAVIIDCGISYPRCKDDYPIYYKLQLHVAWSGWSTPITDVLFRYEIKFPAGAGTISFPDLECGSGISNECMIVTYGEITQAQLNTINHSGTYDFALLGSVGSVGSGVQHVTYDFDVTFSYQPIVDNCSNTYTVPSQYSYTIDPTIETPAGAPTDEQIFNTVSGQTYMLHVADGPWNDGTADRIDAAVSTNGGSSWQSIADFAAGALCVDEDPLNPGYFFIYFSAPSTSIRIRANDTAGAFANNTNDIDTPFRYQIGLAYALVDQTCESQFTYDDSEIFASIALLNSSDADGQRAADAFTHYDVFQPGEWYAVEVTSGTWQDNGGAAKTDLQYVFNGLTASGGDWEDLAAGSPLVQCVHSTEDIVFVQAIDTTLNLRADDLDSNFANNTGTMTVHVYHALRERPSETCEMRFALDDLVRADSVDGNQSNGKVFALTVGSAVTNNDNPEAFLSGGLVPGAWYALETTGGPWGYLANYHYDMAIAQETAGSIGTTPSGDWGPLADWEMADCNIQTDPLGHRLVYFQMPVAGAEQWKLRVNGSGSFFLNSGSMSWNLYRVRDLGFTPDGICDYTYSETDKITPTPQIVAAITVNGGPLTLSANTFYAVEILGEDYQWQDDPAGPDHTDMEISLNNGQTWSDIPGGNVLCTQTAGANLVFFIHTGADPQVKLRVNSTTFPNNSGQMGWNIYTAEAGTSVTGCTTDGYSVSQLGPWEWIPVQDETGRTITSTTASYAEIGGLVAGNTYVIETNRGGWTDGETEIEHFGAEVSSDGGVTWAPMDGTNPDVQCWEALSMKYRKIEITVIDGQEWRIRVADTDTATFTDNGGRLAYTLKGLVLPDDEIVQGSFNLMGCNTPAVSPSISEVDSFTGLANYLAGWFDYSVASFVNFFAWCPDNTAALSLFGTDLTEREPFATLDEFDAALNDVKNELNSYDWGSTEDYSVLDKPPAESAAMINDYVFGEMPDDSPWVNGDLVDLSPVEVTDYYENCTWAAADYVGPRLAGGVCFASNWAKEVGFTFYIQLMLDVGVMFACIGNILETLTNALAMLTGVNLNVKRR